MSHAMRRFKKVENRKNRLFFSNRTVERQFFHHLRLPSKLEAATMAWNTTAATTQIIQLYPQLFVERLYPKYTAAAIDQYTTEIFVVTDCFCFFSFE